MKPIILLIDDDNLVMRFYIRALERAGFSVRQLFSPDTTLELIEKEKPNLAAIILDIMMLPGKKYGDKNTSEGLRTGVFLYEDLRSYYPDVPIVVLTNVTDQETLQHFSEVSGIKVANKLDYPPLELTQLTIEMIENTKRVAVS